MKELEATKLRSHESDRLEVRAVNKPLFDNRDMCGFMCIICAALITYLLFSNGKVAYYSKIQFAGTVISCIFFMSVIFFWLTQKIVHCCHKRAKRKAQDTGSRT